jgi:hypothetical protein
MKKPLLMLSVAPPFQDGFAITLMENAERNTSSYVLRYEEIKLPSRENVGQEFSLSEDLKGTTDAAEDILRILEQTPISVAPAYALGLDGIGYELNVTRGLNIGIYKWWNTIPQGWEALATISNALLQLAGKPEIAF